MKIQCDVCNKQEASVFCTADEAALCDGCDHRVHHANKLASKHQRFSLLHPSAKQFPVCDVCQEKRAIVFCQQDRAILCRDCDIPIHTSNEHTQKHNRFLLTGVKLSATSTIYTSSSSASKSNGGDLVPDSKSQPSSTKKPVTVSPVITDSSSIHKNSFSTTTTTTTVNIMNDNGGNNLIASESGGSTSSISEYLIETLPGWHVEDLLDSSSDPFGFCKSSDGMLPFADTDFEYSMNSLSSSNTGTWVPQAPPPLQTPLNFSQNGWQTGFKEMKETLTAVNNNRRWLDDGFTVPQISPPSKRSRPNFW